MKKRNWIATEAIAFQGKEVLYDKLKEAIQVIVDNGSTAEAVAKSKIESLIKDTLGLNVKASIVGDGTEVPNASMGMPVLDINHPFTNAVKRGITSSTALSNLLRKLEKYGLTGILDRTTSKVSGDFSLVEFDLVITRSIIKNLSVSQLTEVILHELGHAWTYLERIVDSVISNYAIYTAAAEMMKLESIEERITLINATAAAIRLKEVPAEDIAKSTESQSVITHLCLQYIKERRTEEGHRFYSNRACEFSADQFVVRHGGGKELVTGLYRLNNGTDPVINKNASILVAVSKFVGAVFKGFATVVGVSAVAVILPIVTIPVLGYMAYAFVAWFDDEPRYDKPFDRYRRIINEMKSELKNKGITKERREAIIADVSYLEEILKQEGKGNTEVVKLCIDYLFSSRRAMLKHESSQQQLERLVHNDLYLASAKFA